MTRAMFFVMYLPKKYIMNIIRVMKNIIRMMDIVRRTDIIRMMMKKKGVGLLSLIPILL